MTLHIPEGLTMNYKEYLKTMIRRRGTLDMPEDGSCYTLRFNESDARLKNAHLVEVQDDFVVIHHDHHGMLKIPLLSLVDPYLRLRMEAQDIQNSADRIVNTEIERG